jgi:S-adenosyl-L-methionine hydrolase (adenosine-forming)
MQLVTLTTDYGFKDYYVAAVKGALYKEIKGVTVIDIAHEIPPFNVYRAAFQTKCAFSEFPDGTIHICGVDAEPNLTRVQNLPLILVWRRQYFISADNGFFGELLNNGEAEELYCYKQILEENHAWNFAMLHCFVKLAKRIANDEHPSNFCQKVTSYQKMLSQNSLRYSEHKIFGNIIDFDFMGNAITNVSKSLFQEVGQGTPFKITIGEGLSYGYSIIIDVISRNYFEDVTPATPIAIFNNLNLMEIAMTKAVEGRGGGASSLLALKIGDRIVVEFFPPGSMLNLDAF